MVAPGALSRAQVAGVLKCPESFVDVLASRGVLPWPVDVHALSRARLRHRWLNVLGEPVGERDLMRIDPSLHLPESGTTVLGGRRYAPLWRVLSEAWKPDEPDGGRASALFGPVRGRASGSSAPSEPVAPVRDA